VPSTHVHKQEPSGSETESSDSENLYADYKGESIMNRLDIDAGGKRGTSGLEGGEILVDGQ
jgi:hypothetical protein